MECWVFGCGLGSGLQEIGSWKGVGCSGGKSEFAEGRRRDSGFSLAHSNYALEKGGQGEGEGSGFIRRRALEWWIQTTSVGRRML